MEDNHIKFDFLGKDSIRYENEVQVSQRVYELVQEFCRKDEKGKRESPIPQIIANPILCSSQMLRLNCMSRACSSLMLWQVCDATSFVRGHFL